MNCIVVVTHEFANHGVILCKVSQLTSQEHDKVTNLGETTRIHDLKGQRETLHEQPRHTDLDHRAARLHPQRVTQTVTVDAQDDL